jgi:hypothetical protein
VSEALERGVYFPSRLGSEDGFGTIDRYDCCEFAIHDLQCTIGRSKLYAVARGKDSMLGTENFHARRAHRAVLDCSPIIAADADSVMFWVDRFDACIRALCKAQLLVAAAISNDVADFVVTGVGALSSGKVAI